jgi:hypothetical protein
MAQNLIQSDSEIEPSDRSVCEKKTSQDNINDCYDSPPCKKGKRLVTYRKDWEGELAT